MFLEITTTCHAALSPVQLNRDLFLKCAWSAHSPRPPATCWVFSYLWPPWLWLSLSERSNLTLSAVSSCRTHQPEQTQLYLPLLPPPNLCFTLTLRHQETLTAVLLTMARPGESFGGVTLGLKQTTWCGNGLDLKTSRAFQPSLNLVQSQFGPCLKLELLVDNSCFFTYSQH